MFVLRLSAGGVSFRHRSYIAGHGPEIRIVTIKLMGQVVTIKLMGQWHTIIKEHLQHYAQHAVYSWTTCLLEDIFRTCHCCWL
ncbi:hypothetical protein Peur_055000 [Populus x canadensis]